MSQALRHARAAGVPEGTQEAPSDGKRLRMCNKSFLNLDWPHPSTTPWRSGYNWYNAHRLVDWDTQGTRAHTHTPPPPAVCAKRLFFVTWQPRVWKKWVQPSVKYLRRTPRTDWTCQRLRKRDGSFRSSIWRDAGGDCREKPGPTF